MDELAMTTFDSFKGAAYRLAPRPEIGYNDPRSSTV